MNISEIKNAVNALSLKRKVFHSEHDFKLAFSLELLSILPNLSVRLERPVDITMIDWNQNETITRAPIDIVAINDMNELILIELKYKTKKINLLSDNEQYILAEHCAQDTGRYSFRKDIFRIESFLKNQKNSKRGYVLILTNDNTYWERNVLSKGNFDMNFSFHNGSVLKKEDKGWNFEKINIDKYEQRPNDKRWWYMNNNKLHWSCKKELFYKLDLNKNYLVDWKSYSKFDMTEFKFCLIEVV